MNTVAPVLEKAPPNVIEVLSSVFHDPYLHLVKRWNWKSAFTSTIIRGAIFFTANLSAGIRAALSAMVTEFAYRALLAGVNGSVTQSLAKAHPPWAAAASAAILLPAANHIVEFTVHYLRGTPNLFASVVASVCFTVVSTLFNAYAMRQGVLVVNEDSKPLMQDLAKMPGIIAGFLAVGPMALWRFVRARRAV